MTGTPRACRRAQPADVRQASTPPHQAVQKAGKAGSQDHFPGAPSFLLGQGRRPKRESPTFDQLLPTHNWSIELYNQLQSIPAVQLAGQ